MKREEAELDGESLQREMEALISVRRDGHSIGRRERQTGAVLASAQPAQPGAQSTLPGGVVSC